MELEHLYTVPAGLALLQMIIGVSLYPGFMERPDLHRAFMKTALSYVLSFTPIAALLYVLHAISGLQ